MNGSGSTAPNGNGLPKLLTAPEVAAILNCSRSEVYRAAADGVIPSIRLTRPGTTAGIVRFRLSDIEALLVERTESET